MGFEMYQTQNPCVSLCHLGLLIYVTSALQPDAACPAHLHSFTDICLAPASGQVMFQARDNHEETDNNPSPRGAETVPEARCTAPMAERLPRPPHPQASPAGALGPDAVLSEHPPSSRRRLSGLATLQSLPPRDLCPSQHRPPSETASLPPA